MINIIVEIRERHKMLSAVPGQTILEVFQENGIFQVHSPCGGNGTCKKCLVDVDGMGMVLACQTTVKDNMKVYIKEDAGAVIAEAGSCRLYDADEGQTGYGIACDIGTTTVVCHLLELQTGKRIGTVSGANAQKAFGADVISRIQASCDGNLALMNQAIIDQINDFTERLCKDNRIDRKQITQMAVAGNTVMGHLFAALPPDSIGVAPFTPKTLFGACYDSKKLGLKFDGRVYIAPAVAGYVGGDITADMLAVGMCESKDWVLLLDIGTNGEMSLGKKDGFVCCATAAGPAFEGAEISMGMPAAKGAVSKVKLVTGKEGQPDIVVETIGRAESIGICGSGLIDALAVLVEAEVIDETGCFAEAEDLPESLAARLKETDEGMVFYLDEHVVVTQGDIRKLQLAKAAIAAGIRVLLGECRLAAEDVSKLVLAGGFGSFLNPVSAAKIGLIPEELLPVTVSVGNAAGEGAVSAVVSAKARAVLEQIQKKSRYIELSTDKSFTQFYMDEMYFGDLKF